MRLPNWFKIAWWMLLVGLLTSFLYERYPALLAGEGVPADVVAFVVWLALVLCPVFSELSLLGLKFKQELKELKNDFSGQLSELRADIKNAVDVRTTFNPQITIPIPPPDSQLPELEKRIKAAIADALEVYAPPQKSAVKPPTSTVSDDLLFLFSVRRDIEVELRRIAHSRGVANESRRPIPVFQLSRALVEGGVFDQRLERALRDVYAICSPAIHGEKVTDAQIAFVRDVGAGLISALRAID